MRTGIYWIDAIAPPFPRVNFTSGGHVKFGAIILSALFMAGCGVGDLKNSKLTKNHADPGHGEIIIEPSGAGLPELPDFSAEQFEQPQLEDESESKVADSNSQEELSQFMESVQKADPQQETILRVFMTEKQELAVVLNRGAEREMIPMLARTLLIQMNKVLPGEQLRIVFYAPTMPLFQIGKAELDIYRGLMTYTSNQSLM